MKGILAALISIYQKTLSPDHGIMRVFFPLGACRFYPSCSEYTRRSIARYGILQGVRMGMGQLLKCHPYHEIPNHKFQIPNKQACFSLRSK
ncbi:MAG: membrane protein insertion efficiency factor YidD [Candidatus Colwellbacteria bacterium]|nr:membrane protein insertion efficiency factor YidD [Candidatus Colwellbacteria bacterium]